MYTLQLQVANFDDLERIIACLKHSADPAVVAQAQIQADSAPVVVEKPKNPRGRPRREVAAPLTESAAPAPETADAIGQDEADNTAAPAQQTYTLADVREALQGVVTRTPGDMRPATQLLADFGAARVSEIKADDYARFITACQIVMAGS